MKTIKKSESKSFYMILEILKYSNKSNIFSSNFEAKSKNKNLNISFFKISWKDCGPHLAKILLWGLSFISWSPYYDYIAILEFIQ